MALVVIAAAVLHFTQLRDSVPVASLLAQEPGPPGNWTSVTGATTQRIWREVIPDAAVRVGPAEITEEIRVYPSPLLAYFAFRSFHRERVQAVDWVSPVRWSYRSISASEEQVKCGVGTPYDCNTWHYWARYGQYILHITRFHPDRGISEDTFSNIVSAIEPQVSALLR